MNMLSEQDITKIGEEVGRVIEDNVMPRMEELLDEKINPIVNRLDGLERRFDRTDGKLNALINVLTTKRVITESDKEGILA